MVPADLLSPEEAADRFGKSKARIIQLVHERRVRRYKEGFNLRISESEVAWWYGLTGAERMKWIERTRRRDFTAVEAAGFAPPQQAQPVTELELSWPEPEPASEQAPDETPTDLVSIREGALLCHCSENTIRRRCAAGLLTKYIGPAPANGGVPTSYYSKAELLRVLGPSAPVIAAPTPESEPVTPSEPAAIPEPKPETSRASFFRALHEAREKVEWDCDTATVHAALSGFDAAVRACLPLALPAFIDAQGYGYFLGYNRRAFEVDRPGRSADWAKAAKLAWADGLWDSTQGKLYNEPSGMAIQTTLFQE
jgi:hypothetical protein